MLKKNRMLGRRCASVARNMTDISLPAAWDCSKRKVMSVNRTNKRARKNDLHEINFKMVQNEIASRILSAGETFEHNVNMQFDDIICKHSFRESMQAVSLADVKASVVEVTRAHEEQYMRENMHGETPCAMGVECECMFIDRSQPFVGTCFMIPSAGHADNNMCVLCLRKTTQLLFYRVVQQGIQSNALLQRYGNICNREGEYHPAAMLICPPSGPVHCMPLPIVAHQRNRYSVVDMHGVKYIKQHGVGMQDFQVPPPPLSV